VHRPVLTFGGMALAIASQCCLPGCATPSSAVNTASPAPAIEASPQTAASATTTTTTMAAPAAASAAVPTRKKAAEPASAAPPAKADNVARARPLAVRANATPPPAAADERPPAMLNRWELNERDRTLKSVIERWAQKAGWRAFWELDVDYPIAATASIGGSFEEAVSVVVRSMDHADVPLKAIFYRGNQVLRVVPRGTE